jgi:formate hydrogenlyase subunit 4
MNDASHVPAALQTLVIIGLAPLLQGAMRAARARMQGRPGPAPWQPYRDLIRYWHQEALQPASASWLVLAAPGVAVGVSVAMAAAVPALEAGLLDHLVDVISLMFLLGLGRFILSASALDSGSGFASMAASREAAFSSLVEPVLLVSLVAAIGCCDNGVALSGLVSSPFGAAKVLAFGAFFVVILAETARIPIDNQETHYELTMIHEGLALNYGGWQLAMLQFSAWVRQAAFFVLASAMLPGGPVARVLWIIALAAVVTLIETAQAKLRLYRVPDLLVSGSVLALASIALQTIGWIAP